VSFANIFGFDAEFNLMGKLFICIMDSRCPRIDPYRTLCFSVLQSQKKFLVI
jgi:hypothetical protein